ncbi:MAG: ATP-dependent RNA helicase DbpA [Granulosicoccus sp.]
MTSEEFDEFSSLPVRSELLQALNAVNYVHMTPIQSQSAAAILDGRDLIAQAQTGSGKTAAFAIGLLNKLDTAVFETQALVICPTRELSEQVAAEIRRLASGLANTKVLTLCGGKPIHDQLNSLKRSPHVVVGTPGRLKKHLDKFTLDIGSVQTLVLDEADRMLDMGFYDDIMQILHRTDDSRQTLLFSATYPDEIVSVSRSIQTNPVEVRIVAVDTTAHIEQLFVFASKEQKVDSLFRAIGKYQPENAIIFCNRKDQAQAVCDTLRQQGMYARALHGDLDQRERDEALILFGNKSISFLVATDVAARGLDISALSAVINYDASPDPETHLHRIGRTGRAGLDGLAITLVDPDEVHHIRALERFLKLEIKFGELKASSQKDAKPARPSTVTLHINAGKKDKIRPGDIVGALTAESQMSNDDIGKITVLAKAAFVAVNVDKADVALSTLANGKIKRQKVRARILQ